MRLEPWARYKTGHCEVDQQLNVHYSKVAYKVYYPHPQVVPPGDEAVSLTVAPSIIASWVCRPREVVLLTSYTYDLVIQKSRIYTSLAGQTHGKT